MKKEHKKRPLTAMSDLKALQIYLYVNSNTDWSCWK